MKANTNGQGPGNVVATTPTLRKGARVLVVPLGQRGIVRQRRRGRVQVHFGSAHGRDYLAWFAWQDLEHLP